jgi:hypothetical protein
MGSPTSARLGLANVHVDLKTISRIIRSCKALGFFMVEMSCHRLCREEVDFEAGYKRMLVDLARHSSSLETLSPHFEFCPHNLQWNRLEALAPLAHFTKLRRLSLSLANILRSQEALDTAASLLGAALPDSLRQLQLNSFRMSYPDIGELEIVVTMAEEILRRQPALESVRLLGGGGGGGGGVG